MKKENLRVFFQTTIMSINQTVTLFDHLLIKAVDIGKYCLKAGIRVLLENKLFRNKK